jgi:hypothetical protein
VAIVAGIGFLAVWLLSTAYFVRAVGFLIGDDEDPPPAGTRSRRLIPASLVERVGILGVCHLVCLLGLTAWLVAS